MKKIKLIPTAERVSSNIADNFVFQRSLFAYFEASKIVSGTVLEIGTGLGYGIRRISCKSEKFITIDKCKCIDDNDLPSNTMFIQMRVPKLSGFADNSVDFVISFQLIEHLKQDSEFVQEIFRVLKDGGKLILTTPNKKMSLTRNPWHVREYSANELEKLLKSQFKEIEKYGIYGNSLVQSYYQLNKLSIQKYERVDLFRLQYKLPNILLRLPYNVLNRINRNKLLNNHKKLTEDIHMTDYYLGEASDSCFDLFFVAVKKRIDIE